MANTPLYKKLKDNGTTNYVFPGASEDINIAYQNNPNRKMYFSKYILLNLPKQENDVFNFEDSFSAHPSYTPIGDYGDQIVESLRNYVANHEVVMRESRLNNTDYYYNNMEMQSSSEKIFWKWVKKLNLIDFEPAIPMDEYFDNLNEFERNNINDDEFFPEYLWREREVIDFGANKFYQTGLSGFGSSLEIELDVNSNFKIGDTINLYNISNNSIVNQLDGLTETQKSDLTDDGGKGLNLKILSIIPAEGDIGQRIILNINYIGSSGGDLSVDDTALVRLVYNRLVQYIGEVNGISNVQEANRSYTEIYAHIPDHTGRTPDILFRTRVDSNYKPGMSFPIIPSQLQPEIIGAEHFNSPIVNNNQDYPGGYYGQFDSPDYMYQTSRGDTLRREGDYFGIKGDINNIKVDSSKIDGLMVDFNREHYVKMNIPNRMVTNFDEFNAIEIDNEPPKDFTYNAILWYYTVEDNNDNQVDNLYGISFINNPKQNPIESDVDRRFPTITKLVSNGNQDGTSYAYNLSLNYNIINDNPVETYNPEAINSQFNMNLFNKAMSRLASFNDNFLNILAKQDGLTKTISDLKGLLYTQTDINTINSRINNLDKLLRLYSTMQIVSSDTIEVSEIDNEPPSIMMEDISTKYVKVDTLLTSEMFNQEGIIPMNLHVPKNRDFMINIVNDDEISLFLENDRLLVILDNDLYLNQTIDININSLPISSENKKLDIYMQSDIDESEILLIGNIDLPVFYNDKKQYSNCSYLWSDFKFDIDLKLTTGLDNIKLISRNVLEILFDSDGSLISNSLSVGDVLYLNDLYIKPSSISDSTFDFSGQYEIVNIIGNRIEIDIANNAEFVNTFIDENFPFIIWGNDGTNDITLLANKPYFRLNKGLNISITRVSNSIELNERYLVSKRNI